jgi:hypothetical protein
MAAALFAAPASGAGAQTYNIAVDGGCDTLTLTLAGGIVAGVSNGADGCDDSDVVGYQAKLPASVAPGGKVLIAAGDLGTTYAWSWAFNLKTKNAELTGTDGVDVFTLDSTFTFTKAKAGEVFVPHANGKPSMVSLIRRHR